MDELEQHYATLGIRPGASLEEVAKARSILIRAWHPVGVREIGNTIPRFLGSMSHHCDGHQQRWKIEVRSGS